MMIRLKRPYGIPLIVFIIASSFCSSPVSAKTATVIATPFSGIGPLEVRLKCISSLSTSVPEKYVIDYGDGTEETVETSAYSHTFTHTYQSGFYKPICRIIKNIGTESVSDPARVIVAKWKFETGDDVDSSPAIGPDGTVYVGSDDGHLYAIDPETGQELWRFKTDGEIQSSPSVHSDGTIYVGSLDKNLYALKPNGTLKWAFNVGDYIFSSPAIGRNGRVIYFGSSDHNLYAVNGTGTLKWKFETGDKIISSPSIGNDGTEDVLYFGSLDNHVYALSADNGQLKWKFKTGTTVFGSPAIAGNGRIYIGECEIDKAKVYDYKLFCLNVDGTEAWHFIAGAGFYSSPAIGPNGHIYVGSWDGAFYSFNARGNLNWSLRAQVTADFNSSPAIGDNGAIYAGCKDGNFYAFHVNASIDEDKLENWVFQTGDDILYSSPVIDSEGTIYFGSRDNCVYAINPGNLELSPNMWPMFGATPGHTGIKDVVIPPVISTDPITDSLYNDVDISEIKVNFAPDIETDQIDVESFKLYRIDDNQTEIEGFAVLDFNRYNNTAYHLTAVFTRLNSEEPLQYNTKYMAAIKYSSQVESADQDEESEPAVSTYSWEFLTEAEEEDEPDSDPGPSCFINSMMIE